MYHSDGGRRILLSTAYVRHTRHRVSDWLRHEAVRVRLSERAGSLSLPSITITITGRETGRAATQSRDV
jgi:hypothetical protein